MDPRTGSKIKKGSPLYEFFKKQYKLMLKERKRKGKSKNKTDHTATPSSPADHSLSLLDEVTAKKSAVVEKKKEEAPKTKYIIDGRPVTFGKQTMVTYAKAREMGFDMLMGFAMDNPKKAYRYKYMWDSYTGECLTDKKGDRIEDPYGPLHYDAGDLVNWFYSKRLSGLWVEQQGDFQAMYGEYVGSGMNLQLLGRGDHPERYLFRLPIHDCYLMDDYDTNIHTMGPRLTKSEVEEIYRLACTQASTSGGLTRRVPNIVTMWDYYHGAIEQDPYIEGAESLEVAELVHMRDQINRQNVDQLRRMRY